MRIFGSTPIAVLQRRLVLFIAFIAVSETLDRKFLAPWLNVVFIGRAALSSLFLQLRERATDYS
jgi:hypothetical protein